MYSIVFQEYLRLRKAAVEQMKKSGDNPYPHKFNVTLSLTEFIEKYNSLSEGQHHTDVVSVAGTRLLNASNIFYIRVFQNYFNAGRIHSKRSSGAKLVFYDLRGEGTKIQIMANAK